MLSDLSLLWMSGLKNPKLLKQAVDIKRRQPGESVVKGLSNEDLFKEFRARRLIGSGQINILGDIMPQGLEREVEEAGWLARMANKHGKEWAEKANAAAQTVNQKVDKIFEMAGANWEDTAKSAAALDWLKKNVPEGVVPTADDLDAAALHAKEYLFDYGDLSPMMRSLRDSVMPFISWQRNIIGRTLKDMGAQPHRLANLGRFYDTILQPVEERTREDMPPWMKERGPISGILGFGLGQGKKGEPQIGLAGRFMPHGTIEEWYGRPTETAFNLLGPVPKFGYEMTTGESSYFDRPIDELAGGAWGAMVNPLIGKPYSLARDPIVAGIPQTRLPAGWHHALRQWVPGGRQIGMVEELTGPDMTGGEKLMWWLTGGKTYPFDRERAAYWKRIRERQPINRLRAQMRKARRRGDMQAYRHAYEQLRDAQKTQPWNRSEPAQ
jgi:hypothetical protein